MTSDTSLLVSIDRASFLNNTAFQNGGAISVTPSSTISTGGTVEVKSQGEVKFSNNLAGNFGGAVYLNVNDLSLSASSWTCVENFAIVNGGVLYLSSAAESRANFSGSVFSRNSAEQNGGVFAVSSNLKFDVNIKINGYNHLSFSNCSFSSNFAQIAGGVFYAVHSSAKLSITDSVIEDNHALLLTALGGVGYFFLGVYGIMVERTNMAHNSAGLKGGVFYGGYFSGNQAINEGFFHSTDYTFNLDMLGSSCIGNSAASGGVVYVDSINYHFNIADSIFLNNTATLDGGVFQLYLSTNVGSMTVLASRFENNEASGYGGVMYGQTVLLSYTGSALQLRIHGTSFDSNVALNGSALYLSDASDLVLEKSSFIDHQGSVIYATGVHNSLALSTSIFNNTQAVAADGGVLGVSDFSTVSIDSCHFIANEGYFGGAVFITGTGKSVNVTNSIFAQNSAQEGGAVTIEGWYIAGSVSIVASHFISNVAGGLQGGAVVAGAAGIGGALLFDHVAWAQISRNVFSANQAAKGSAVYSSSSIAVTFSDNHYIGNIAANGGTIFWENCLLSNLPSDTRNNFTDNVAPYGQHFASQPIVILNSEPSIEIENFGSAMPEINIRLIDFFNNTVGNSSQVVSMGIAHQHCQPNIGYLTGTLLESCKGGAATFSGVVANCAPAGNITAWFSTTFGDSQRTVIVGPKTYNPTTMHVTSVLRFRSCRPGEYLDGGACSTCAVGTYSVYGAKLTDDSTTEAIPNIPIKDLVDIVCKAAPPNADAARTVGNQIYANPGYWRISPQAETLLICPLGQAACIGGAGTGMVQCILLMLLLAPTTSNLFNNIS